jgi:hypothetical protein
VWLCANADENLVNIWDLTVHNILVRDVPHYYKYPWWEFHHRIIFSKVWVCGLSLLGIENSNSGVGMDVYLAFVLRVV